MGSSMNQVSLTSWVGSTRSRWMKVVGEIDLFCARPVEFKGESDEVY